MSLPSDTSAPLAAVKPNAVAVSVPRSSIVKPSVATDTALSAPVVLLVMVKLSLLLL